MYDSTPLVLRSSLGELTQALAAGKTIKIENGHWVSLGLFSRIVSFFKREESHHLHRLITSVNQLFDEIETGRSLLNSEQCETLGKALYARCRNAKPNDLKLAAADLNGRILSVYYRIHQKSEMDQALYDKILNAAETWLNKDILFSHLSLTQTEKNRLKEVACYPKFAEHLFNNKMERKRFFRWTIRHKNTCESYILFRSTTEKLTQATLSNRIGYYGGTGLKVMQEGNDKILTLRINGMDCDIRDGSRQYTLSNNYTLSVNEMFSIFEQRQTVIGNLEYFPGVGIVNWNPKRLGRFNPATKLYDMIDLNLERWWEQLPPVATITNAEASEMFEDQDGNKIPCDGSRWIVSIYATTDSLEVDATGNHAYLQIAVPTGDGHYNLYPFGKFTEEYPITASEKKKVAVEPMDAVIMYPEENIFNLDRYEEGISWALTPEEGISRMNSIRKDIQRVRQKNIVFQLFNDNCIIWCFLKMHRYVTEEQKRFLAGVRFLEATPSGFLGYVWEIFRCIPEFFLEPTLNYLMGKIGGEKVVSIIKKNGRRLEKGLLKRVPWKSTAAFPHPGAFVIRKRNRKYNIN